MGKLKKALTAICVLLTCGILVCLGVWQLHRLAWKLDLISRIAAQANIDPQTVSLQSMLDDPANNLSRGFLQGRYLQDKTVRVGPHMVSNALGYWIVSPLKLFGGRIVLVNRGWIAENTPIPAPPSAMTTVAGTLRISDKPAQPVAGDVRSWHKLDAPGIAKAMNLPDTAPMVLFAESSVPKDASILEAAPVTSELRNDHLQYAIFWFTMAGILFLSFVFFSFRGRR